MGANEPGKLVTVDFYGPIPKSIAGVQYIFVLIDAFSKYVRLYPVKRATTRIILSKLENDYFKHTGKPSEILVDNGS